MTSRRMGLFGRCGALMGAAALLAACGGSPPDGTHTVGGTVSGLTGTVVLQNNAGDDLKLSADGTFTFPAALTAGSAHAVSVKTQPLWQICTVANGSGQASATVADVSVTCSTAPARVTTLAGSGVRGSTNDQGTAARLDMPFGIVSRPDGSLLLTEATSGLVRSISPTGDVTTLAGGGPAGSVDGQGTGASFQSLAGMALDAGGNAYVAEFNGHRIRRITPDGHVTTVAGNGHPTTLDGQGTFASFYHPGGVATNAAGDIYVLEYLGQVVRRIAPTGDVTTLAGPFLNAYGLATDKAGHLYVADTANHRILKVTPAGVITPFAGSGRAGAQDGPASAATFVSPTGLAVDGDGNVYVADTGNSLLRRITRTGVVSTLAGQQGVSGHADGIGANALLRQPYGVTLDAEGNLLLADTFGHRIRKITPVR